LLNRIDELGGSLEAVVRGLRDGLQHRIVDRPRYLRDDLAQGGWMRLDLRPHELELVLRRKWHPPAQHLV